MRALIALPTICLIGLSSCSQVPIRNSTWCVDKGGFGARCGLAKKEEGVPNFGLNKEDWDRKRFGWACTSAETLSNWRSALKKLCEDSPSTCYFFRDEQNTTEEALDNVLNLAK